MTYTDGGGNGGGDQPAMVSSAGAIPIGAVSYRTFTGGRYGVAPDGHNLTQRVQQADIHRNRGGTVRRRVAVPTTPASSTVSM